jgi:hypothetical protein
MADVLKCPNCGAELVEQVKDVLVAAPVETTAVDAPVAVAPETPAEVPAETTTPDVTQ